MGRILVVEDEPEIGSLLKDYLQQVGHSCEHLLDGESAWSAFQQDQWDLVLLDVMMPNLDGLELCRRIRERSRVPIFFITARHDEVDRIVGLKLGADDYIVKPFSPREVVARVEAQLRRQQWLSDSTESALSASGLWLDPDAYRAQYAQVELELTPVEFRLLHTLSTQPGRVYRREELLHSAYDDHRVVGDRTVDSHIKNLRQKLAAAGAPDTLIQAVYGVGYKYSVAS